jgi:hypothetical protein
MTTLSAAPGIVTFNSANRERAVLQPNMAAVEKAELKFVSFITTLRRRRSRSTKS